MHEVLEYMEKAACAAEGDPRMWGELFIEVANEKVDPWKLEAEQLAARTPALLKMLEARPERMVSSANLTPEIQSALQTGMKCVVVVGDTGSGKSCFCSVLDGSLRFDESSGHAVGNFPIGHGVDSETNTPNIRLLRWFGETDSPQVCLVDTPGLGDSRGQAKDP